MKRSLAQRVHLNYAMSCSSRAGVAVVMAPLSWMQGQVACFSAGRKSAALGQKTQSKPGSALDTNSVKGTRDFYPDDQRQQSWLFQQWRTAAMQHGFEEYDAPVVEQANLYTRKAGEEIAQQLYTFEDKSGRKLSLRPEMTPSLARMVLAKGNALPLPIKWYSLPQCWRYEKMSRGRRREHYQWNMDIWGVQGVEAEAEVLSALVTSLQNMGLTSQDVGIKVNSKKIIDAILESFDVLEADRAAACILVDKWDKVPREVLHEEMRKILPDLSAEKISELLDTINVKDMEEFKTILGHDCVGLSDVDRLFSLADAYGYRDWLVFDATIVRGLSYYTGIVFEAFDRKGELRAICGGGRYDHLLDSFTSGSKSRSIPAVGFGFGDAVIIELLKSRGLLPDVSTIAVVDVVVCALVVDDTAVQDNNTLQQLAIRAAKSLRDKGLAVDLVLEKKRAKWMFQRADRLNAGYTLMFAAEELESDSVVLKDMKLGSQRTISFKDAVDEVSSLCR